MTNQQTPPASGRRTRREEILSIAAAVIADRGLAGATVRDIGQAAGILSGSLYHHFESKEQIVLDLLLDDVTAKIAEAEQIAAEAADATTALAEMITSSVRQTALKPHGSTILHNETRAFELNEALAPLAELRRAIAQIFVDTVQRGVDSGEFRSDTDPEVVVLAIFDGALGSARWFLADRTKDVDAVAATLVDLYLGGIAAT